MLYTMKEGGCTEMKYLVSAFRELTWCGHSTRLVDDINAVW